MCTENPPLQYSHHSMSAMPVFIARFGLS